MALIIQAVVIQPTPAKAQGYGYGYDYGYSQQWWKSANKKPKPQKARTNKRPSSNTAKTAVVVADKLPEGPLVLVVSLKLQRVTVYDQSGVVATSPISSGRVGNPTPLGVFSVLEKQKIHYSNLYDSAPMPNMQRITWSGVAMHAGVLPGYPASHGCIRLPHGFSQRLFNMTKTGARVIVARDDVPVQSFTHATLFPTTAFEADSKMGAAHHINAGDKVADASGRTVGSGTSGSSLIGIGTAQAAAPTDPTRVSAYRQKWLVEMEHRSQALSAAEANKAAATAKIASTAQTAESAIAELKAARIEPERLAQAIKKNVALRNSSEKELDTFAKNVLTARQLSDEQVQNSALREEALDARLSAITAEIDTLTAGAAKVGDRLKAAEQLVQSTEIDRKTALNELSKANADLKIAQDSVNEAKRREAKRQLPVAVFISRQSKKLYVRQGYAPVLETAVEIAAPDKPMGTHVFTALAVGANNKDMTWSVASVPTGAQSEERSKDKLRKKDAAKLQPVVTPQSYADQTPAAALDRIKIPDEAREMIADSMKPGSSLIVSDYGISNETGVYTDFIVSLR